MILFWLFYSWPSKLCKCSQWIHSKVSPPIGFQKWSTRPFLCYFSLNCLLYEEKLFCSFHWQWASVRDYFGVLMFNVPSSASAAYFVELFFICANNTSCKNSHSLGNSQQSPTWPGKVAAEMSVTALPAGFVCLHYHDLAPIIETVSNWIKLKFAQIRSWQKKKYDVRS